MRKSGALFFIFGFLAIVFSVTAFALDDDMNESGAEQKARQAHEKAGSDMLYQNEEWKALYYQNQRIIQLLKDMRDSLETIRAHSVAKTSEEKTA